MQRCDDTKRRRDGEASKRASRGQRQVSAIHGGARFLNTARGKRGKAQATPQHPPGAHELRQQGRQGTAGTSLQEEAGPTDEVAVKVDTTPKNSTKSTGVEEPRNTPTDSLGVSYKTSKDRVQKGLPPHEVFKTTI